MRMPDARDDVLQAVGIAQGLPYVVRFGGVEGSAACLGEVDGVGGSLGLDDSVDGRDQLDQIVNRAIALFRCGGGIDTPPFQLVHDRVLGLLLPVKEEDVLGEFGQLPVIADAFAVMRLREQLDVQGQPQHRPAAPPKDGRGNLVGVPGKAVA